MNWENKVVWSEGLFLQPQHLQQQDRYVDRLVRASTMGLRPFAWGLTELSLDTDMLTLGKFALRSAAGILPDGTPFTLPDDADPPRPIDLPENARNVVAHPGEDQKASVVDDAAQPAGALGSTPADPAVAHRALPGWRSEHQATQGPPLLIAHPILQVLSHSAAIAQVMVLVQRPFQLPPPLRVFGSAQFLHWQRKDILQDRDYRALVQSESRRHGRTPRTSRGFHAHWRQLNPTLGLKFEQQGARGHVFELARSRPPVPESGQLAAEPVAAPVLILIQQRLNLRERLGAEGPALKHCRYLHHRPAWQEGGAEPRPK